jgi:hypothetical protein
MPRTAVTVLPRRPLVSRETRTTPSFGTDGAARPEVFAPGSFRRSPSDVEYTRRLTHTAKPARLPVSGNGCGSSSAIDVVETAKM